MANRLASESSPYLRQHAENPVDWYPWSDDAFSRARSDDKPILLSVGYSACHWCHVMAHESFEDAETATLMNTLFVNIKVDREERPDVDSIYMQAVQALSGRGGWPMTVFLTPDGTPYFGGTYFPPEPRHGMLDFRTVLQAAADAYHERRDAVEAAGAQLRQFLEPQRPRAEGQLTSEHLESATDQLLEAVDWDDGGFGGAPKFPHPAAVDFLLRRWQRHGDPRTLDAAYVCLDRMARGGIFDHVGGGFHRYSVDRQWSVPHFEKMLYDNAQLVPVYLHAWQISGRDRWRGVVESTLDYLVREMRLPDGGFAASQDADSPGGEGSFFVWDFPALRAVLGDNDATLAARAFGVTETGNFEGSTVLALVDPLDVVALELGLSIAELAARVDAIRTSLYAARLSRPAPARDDKVLTSWNALAVAAFAEAGAVLDRSDYIEVARVAADFLVKELIDGDTIFRTWTAGQAKITGFLEDVSYLAAALLTLFEATGQASYFAQALALSERIFTDYADGGVLFDTAATAEALLVRPRTLDDNPLPAGQSVTAVTALRLYGYTGDYVWRARALSIIEPLAGAIAQSPLAVSTLAIAADMAAAPLREIAIVGTRGDAATREMVATAWREFDPARVLAWGDGGALVPLLRDRPLIDGKPAAYVCVDFACRLPVTSAAALRDQLRSGVAAG